MREKRERERELMTSFVTSWPHDLINDLKWSHDDITHHNALWSYEREKPDRQREKSVEALPFEMSTVFTCPCPWPRMSCFPFGLISAFLFTWLGALININSFHIRVSNSGPFDPFMHPNRLHYREFDREREMVMMMKLFRIPSWEKTD